MAQQQMPMLGSMSQEQMQQMLDQQRNQRLAQMLQEQGNAPIQYDQRGAISPWQGAAKLAAALGGSYAQNKADQGQMAAAQMQQQKLRDTFGVGAPASGATPQALGAALGGQQNGLVIPELGAEKSMFLYQNNPELYKEIVGKNLQLTENQKNYGGQLGALNDATIAEKRAQAAKAAWLDMTGGNTATNVLTGQQIGANRVIENDLGNAKQMLSVNPLTNQTNVLRTDAKGLTPSERDAQNTLTYQYDANGNMVALPTKQRGGGAPVAVPVTDASGNAIGKQLKPIPEGVNKAIIENNVSLNKIDSALNALKQNPDAVGLKGYMPNVLLNRNDPEGTLARAAIADIGSLVLHDRSGASVTASESPRLLPFIPLATDDNQTAEKKLKRFKEIYEQENQGISDTYSKDQGYKPSPILERKQQPAQGAQSQEAKDAADWIAKNPNDTRVAAIRAHYGI